MNYTHYNKEQYDKAINYAKALSYYSNSLHKEISEFIIKQAEEIKQLQHWEYVSAMEDYDRREAQSNFYNCGEL